MTTNPASTSASAAAPPPPTDPSHEMDGTAPSPPSTLSVRPALGARKSSGSIIIPRDSETIEAQDEEYDEGDARAMSPRRSMEQVEKMGDEAREALEEQARILQANLLEIVDRVETVKSEHEKLEGGNKFLQSYIGELMQTSKITSTGAAGGGTSGAGGNVSGGGGGARSKARGRK